MCGRFALSMPLSIIAREVFGIASQVGDLAARYNIAPGTSIGAFRADPSAEQGGAAELCIAHWGFRPPWAQESAPQPINARAEKVATSNYFRSSFAKRRCIVPASGWYEWQRAEDGTKQPHYITVERGVSRCDVLLLAGIYAEHETPEGLQANVAILTEPATAAVRHIHDCQPVVLDPECRWSWLDPGRRDRDDIRAAARRLDPGALTCWPVSPRVNKPENDDESLIEPVAA